MGGVLAMRSTSYISSPRPFNKARKLKLPQACTSCSGVEVVEVVEADIADVAADQTLSTAFAACHMRTHTTSIAA